MKLNKLICPNCNAQLNIKLDKRKLDLENSISSLGTYEIPIQLHKDVVAKIKLFVVEEQ